MFSDIWYMHIVYLPVISDAGLKFSFHIYTQYTDFGLTEFRTSWDRNLEIPHLSLYALTITLHRIGKIRKGSPLLIAMGT